MKCWRWRLCLCLPSLFFSPWLCLRHDRLCRHEILHLYPKTLKFIGDSFWCVLLKVRQGYTEVRIVRVLCLCFTRRFHFYCFRWGCCKVYFDLLSLRQSIFFCCLSDQANSSLCCSLFSLSSHTIDSGILTVRHRIDFCLSQSIALQAEERNCLFLSHM